MFSHRLQICITTHNPIPTQNNNNKRSHFSLLFKTQNKLLFLNCRSSMDSAGEPAAVHSTLPEFRDSGEAEIPFLRRNPSDSRRRKSSAVSGAGGDPASLPATPRVVKISRTQSFRREMEHAAAETFLVTHLTWTLLGYLGVGYQWIRQLLALVCYAMLLMPGFLQVGYYYFYSTQVRRSIVYGEQPRNRLDLYLPVDNNKQKPVVAFVTGGAWIIGYKAWGALLGKRLAERGIVVACIDYRNFPQGTISDMVQDASQGISFVCNNIESFGGDPNRIYIMGQSAGAHIAACSLMDQAARESRGDSITWSVSQIKGFFGLSGGYNLKDLVDHFHKRGLYRSIFLSIMEGEQSLRQFSPELIVSDPSFTKAASLLPKVVLFHGTSDYSIPSAASENFANALEKAGVEVRLVLYEDQTHTDLFIQAPLRGGKDELLEDLIALIQTGQNAAFPSEEAVPKMRRLVPEWQIQLARKISPF